jgi:hypothetical protein
MPGRGAHRKEMGERWRVVNTLRLLRLSRSMGWRRRGGESLSPSPSLSHAVKTPAVCTRLARKCVAALNNPSSAVAALAQATGGYNPRP